MLRITTHIERALLENDCVVVPEVGGFVFQTLSAIYREKDHTFVPMRKEIIFNKALQHNDGLLTESYVQMYDVDFRKAQQMLEEDIAELKSALQQHGKVSLGPIGSINRGGEGQYIYRPGKPETFDVEHYGLHTFQFPVLPKISPAIDNAEAKKKDIFYIPINRRWVRGIVSSAAAIALFLLISTPVKEVNQSAYKASFIPTEMVLPKTVSVQPEVREEKTEAPVVEAKATPTTSPTASTVVAAPVSNPKMFHIVIGSFPAGDQAEDFLQKVDRDTYGQAGIIARGDRHRVYARRYDNREEAEVFLETIREEGKYKDAWLFISR